MGKKPPSTVPAVVVSQEPPRDPDDIIVVDSVSKVFTAPKPFRAVDRASFRVRRGDIFGFIGPNGAGKTTCLRMIATLSEPDEGEVWVCGYNTIDQAGDVRRVLGYMPDDAGMYDGVRVWEYLEFYASAYRIRGPKLKRVVEDTIELTDLGEVREKLIASLSKGMRQRLILAKTLLHEPQVLVLDEPAAGLDPRARIELRILLKELQRMGRTIIISSHILTELSDVCDSVGIIEQGRMLAHGPVDQLVGRRVEVLRLRVRVLDEVERTANLLRAVGRITDVTPAVDENIISFDFEGTEADIPELLRALLDGGAKVVGVEQERRNLEDIFLTVTRGAVA